MRKINSILTYFRRHIYLLVILIGVAITGVIDENSFRKQVMLHMELSELKAELEKAEEQFERDSIRLSALNANQKGVERIARERYFMKRPNEDIFILSTDKNIEDNNVEK